MNFTPLVGDETTALTGGISLYCSTGNLWMTGCRIEPKILLALITIQFLNISRQKIEGKSRIKR
jgi:hypothetical protein